MFVVIATRIHHPRMEGLIYSFTDDRQNTNQCMDKTGQRCFVVRSTRAADNNNDLDSPATTGRGRVWE